MTTASIFLAESNGQTAGIGSSGAMQNAAGASALLMIALIAFLCIGILIFALNLRRRALHPSPEALLLAEIGSDPEFQESHPAGEASRRDGSNRQEWERPDDWWKASSSNS